MALNSNALFTAASGFIYTGAVGATAPTPSEIAAFTDATGLGAAWESLGHTSREDLPEFGFEGGDVETRGTWQNAALREVITEAAVDYMVFRLHQWDDEALSLYYGVENASGVDGVFSVETASTGATERALAMVIVDGPNKVGFYAPKASIRRDDSIEMSVDEFAVLPIRATFLKPDLGNMFSWISPHIEVESP